MNNKKFLTAIGLLIISLYLFTACNLPDPNQVIENAKQPDLDAILTQTILEQQGEAESDPLPPTEEPTPEAPKEVLTVCLGKEPQTLFFYNESSQAMWTVLETIYDGPFDLKNGEEVPVIFESVEMETVSVPVAKDTVIYDDDDQIVAVNYGITLSVSNGIQVCGTEDCHFTWNSNRQDVEMLQTVIRFKLKSGLKWSDGELLTAEDSVFSMNVNGMRDIKASKSRLNLTESYEAVDEQTIVWKGIPGYAPLRASEMFWTPLPKHLMHGKTTDELLKDEMVNRKPVGWGAYQIASWTPGEEIVTERNPLYLKEDGSQPYFDKVVFRFFGSAGDNNLEALRNGTCDLIDTSVDLSPDLEPILEDVRDEKLAIYVQPQLTSQQITFGISSLQSNRSAVTSSGLFLEKEVRQAFAQCIDRKALNRQVYYGQSEVPVDFYPSTYAFHDPTLSMPLAFDPEAGLNALLAAGWADEDGDPNTPLTSLRVPYVPYGEPLKVRLDISDSEEAKKAAEMIRENLSQCGIEAEINAQPIGKLYGQGPVGTLFGRNFDLALFSWAAGNTPCEIYTSDQIPTDENHWVGTNVGGFASTDYDRVCKLPGAPNPTGMTAGQMYADEMPAIPLYFNLSIAASSRNLCGVANTIDSRSILWNVESLSRSSDACAVSQWKNIYQPEEEPTPVLESASEETADTALLSEGAPVEGTLSEGSVMVVEPFETAAVSNGGEG